jgi:hypothetical protein
VQITETNFGLGVQKSTNPIESIKYSEILSMEEKLARYIVELEKIYGIKQDGGYLPSN